MKSKYITVFSWMSKELNLSGNELLAYAIVYGFSQDGETAFKGGSKYVSEALNISRKTAVTVLNSLSEKNLIIKSQEKVNEIVFNRYMANMSVIQDLHGGMQKLHTPYEEITQGGYEEITQGGYVKITHSNNNKGINNLSNNIGNNKNTLAHFTEFYNSYPKKVGKAQAKKAFSKVCKSETDFAAIMAGLSKQNELRFEPMIAAGQKQYIPYPATWLNERRWEDDVEPFRQGGAKKDINFRDLL